MIEINMSWYWTIETKIRCHSDAIAYLEHQLCPPVQTAYTKINNKSIHSSLSLLATRALENIIVAQLYLDDWIDFYSKWRNCMAIIVK